MRTLLGFKAPAWAAGASLLSAVGLQAQAVRPSADTLPVVTLPGTELKSLHSAVTGRDYDIQISLPADYARNRSVRYPVLYVLDGQWDFKLMLSIQGGLTYDRWTPPIIIVGMPRGKQARGVQSGAQVDLRQPLTSGGGTLRNHSVCRHV